MAKILYNTILIPFSILPLTILYGLGRGFYFLIFHLFGYRYQVVYNNLQSSFPNKSDEELKEIAKKFYKHFSDVFVEGLKGFSISRKQILKRYRFTNPELLDEYYSNNQSVLLVSGHYNNWEFLVQSLNLQFKHQGVGVGKPITSKGFGKIMDSSRKRFGMVVWNHTNVREEMKNYLDNNIPFTCMLLTDQSPGDPDKSYWMKFLNQNTPTLFGPEYFAVKYNLPVFYYDVIKKKRGYYELTLHQVTDNPKEEAYGDITYKHNKLLEKTIINHPEYWLWSHKRWKHSEKAPELIRT